MPPLIGVYATLNTGSLRRMFARLNSLDIKAVFKDLVGPTRFDQRHHWRKEESPDQHWPGLAASTLARRTRARGRDKNGKNRSWPTKLMGRFPTALKLTPSVRSLVVLSRVKRFSYVHQNGGRVGHGARLPRRQFLWFSSFLLAQARKAFEQKMLAVAKVP